MTVYPAQIDTIITLPKTTDLVTPVSAAVTNQLREAILNIEYALGVNPGSVYGTVVNRLNVLEADTNNKPPSGPAYGDLGMNYPAPIVIGLQGHPLSNAAPHDGYILIWSTSDGMWEPSAPAPSFFANGDLSGTSTSQTVIGIQGRLIANTAPSDGDILTWSNTDAMWEPKTPAPGFTAGGDLTGTSTSQQVASLTGSSGIVNVPATTSLEFGPHASAATSGVLRFGPLNSGETDLISYRYAGTTDYPILSENGANILTLKSWSDLNLTSEHGKTSITGGSSSMYITSGSLNLLYAQKFYAYASGGTFAFDSDSGLTNWSFNINGTNVLTIKPNELNIKNGSHISFPDAAGNAAASGFIRLGNILNPGYSPYVIISCLTPGGADTELLYTDGAGDVYLQSSMGYMQVTGATAAILACTYGNYLDITTSDFLIHSGYQGGFHVEHVNGVYPSNTVFTFDSDTNLTGWNFNINAANAFNVRATNAQIPGANYLQIGSDTGIAQSGSIRIGNVMSVAKSILMGRNAAATADVGIITSDGAGDIIFGDQYALGLAVLGGGTAARLTVAGAHNFGVESAGYLSAYDISGYLSGNHTGPFTFNSDALLTEWDFSLNSAAVLSVRPTNLQIPGTNYLQIGGDTGIAQSGKIRMGDVNGTTATTLLAYRNTANTLDIPIISTDSYGDILFSGHSSGGKGLQLTASAVSLNSGIGNFQVSEAYNSLLCYFIPGLKTLNVTGPFTFDSTDTGHLTGWNFNIDNTNKFNISTTGISVPAFTTAGIIHNSSAGLFTSSLIVNADVSSSAAIAGTKVSPAFGSQALSTSGTATLSGSVLIGASNQTVSHTGAMVYNSATLSTSQTLDASIRYGIIFIDVSAGAITLTLPAPVAGRVWRFKHVAGTLSTSNLTFARYASEKIDGVAASRVISADGWNGDIYSNGTDWFIAS